MSTEKTDTIISVTEAACHHIRSYTAELGETAGFRIATKKSGCSGFSYVVDAVKAPLEGDLCFVERGVPIYIPQGSVEILRGTVVDCVDKGTGQRRLVFDNPNVKGVCGCGESFTLDVTGAKG